MLTALDAVDFPELIIRYSPCPQDAAGLLFGGNLLAAFQDIQDFQAVMPVGCHIFPAPVIDAEMTSLLELQEIFSMGIGNHGAILSCRRRAGPAACLTVVQFPGRQEIRQKTVMFILAQRGPEGNPKGSPLWPCGRKRGNPKGKDEEMMTERRKRREWTLLAVVVLFWFAQYVYIPYQTPFLTGKGVAAWMIGTVVGAYGVTQMIFRLPVGVMADWAGRTGSLCLPEQRWPRWLPWYGFWRQAAWDFLLPI